MYSHCFPSNAQSTVILKPCNIHICLYVPLAQTLQPVQIFEVVQDRSITKLVLCLKKIYISYLGCCYPILYCTWAPYYFLIFSETHS